MIGVILAAGMAKRMRPLTDSCPKALLMVGTRTLLQRNVDALVDNGITEIVVVTGYCHDMIEVFLKKHYPTLNIHFILNADYQITNNIYSLWLTRPYCEGKDVLLMDSDILFDPKIISMILAENGNALAINRHSCGEEEMKVRVDAYMDIVELSKTCSCEDAIGESVGFEKMTPEYTVALFNELNIMINVEHLENLFYEQAFERLFLLGHTFHIIDTTNLFSMELDTIDDLKNGLSLIPKELY